MKYVIRARHLFLDLLRFLYHLGSNERVQESFKRYVNSKSKKDCSQMYQELNALWKYWGFIPSQYYTHDFYSKECPLSLEDMKEYIPGYFFYKIIFPQYDDVKKASFLLSDKVTMNNLFYRVGIEQSGIILQKTMNEFSLFSGEEIRRSQISRIISSQISRKLFIKPVSGCGGAGILIATRQENSQYEVNGTLVDDAFLLNLTGSYVVETSIEQSQYMSNIYPDSVNTLRAVTKREPNGEVNLIAVTLRMGINGSQIDNGSAGGILVGVDLSSGKSLRDYATYEFGLERFYHHPDTNFPFGDLIIPNWDEVKKQIVDSAKKLNQINLVGWDVAITDNGIVMIEANTLFGLDHTQSGIGGIRDLFLKRPPKEYYERK